MDLSMFTQCLDSFIHEVEDDFKAPQQSSFQDFMPKLKRDVQSLEESLSSDKSYVRKLTNALKEVIRTGEVHGSAVSCFAEELVKFGTATSATEPDIGNAFVKFGMLFNQMSSLLGNLISSTKSMIFFSLNLLFENELKGAKYKSNVNSMHSQYDAVRNQTEKDEKKQLQQIGANLQDRVFTAEELSAKLIPDRRKYQLGVCEYLLKVLDVRNKSGIDFADHLVAYYQGAQESYFKDGCKLLQAMEQWESKLTTQLAEIRSKQYKEKKRLTAVREELKTELGIGVMKGGGGFIQVDFSTGTELTEKSGYLAKKPEGVSWLPRRQWPKRYCTVSANGFTMANSHTHAPHVRIPVMFFQYKESGDVDGRKFCFKLQAQNNLYVFDAESGAELQKWRQVMTNCQLQLFGGETMAAPSKDAAVNSPTSVKDTRQLVKKIISKIRCLPGNDRCCDCGGPDPEWLSVNLGVLICIHCSGRHRELGVQYSRIRLLKLDALKTSELLIARVMGNSLLNEVFEANLNESLKPSPDADMDQRRDFTTDKYINRKFIDHQIDPSMLYQALLESVEMRDIRQFLQVYAEGADLQTQLLDNGYNALHLVIEQEDLTSLHLVDFILSNGRNENEVDLGGNTPLHIAALTDNPQCIKLLLNHNSNVNLKNHEGKTALDIAEERKYDDCIELLQDAVKSKFSKCEHIDMDWGTNDFVDEQSIYQAPVDIASGGMKRSETTDNILGGGGGVTLNVPSNSPKIRHPSPSSFNRRPMSTLVTMSTVEICNNTKNPYPLSFDPTSSPLPSPPPPDPALSPPSSDPTSSPPTLKSDPSLPPLPRTVSHVATHLSNMNVSVPPRRNKKRVSMISNMLSSPLSSASPPSANSLFIVEALFNCYPDRPDELGFQEGERIIVTLKLNKDWWRGYIENNKTREGLFPSNYVQEISAYKF